VPDPYRRVGGTCDEHLVQIGSMEREGWDTEARLEFFDAAAHQPAPRDLADASRAVGHASRAQLRSEAEPVYSLLH
jgi:hypothetical protein